MQRTLLGTMHDRNKSVDLLLKKILIWLNEI